MTESQQTPTIERRSAGPNGEVTLLHLENGPLNTLDLELCEELTTTLGALAEEGRPVVLTGRGRAFCAGVDLRGLLDGGAGHVRRFVPALDALFRTALTLPVPMVAAVNGHAIAGGAVLAAAADHVVMSDGSGLIGVPELRVGVAFPRGALAVLHHRLGEVSARRVILDAANHTPGDARTLGLVDEVADADRTVERAVDAATRLANLTPGDAFAITKNQLRQDTAAHLTADPEADAAIVDLWCRRVEDGWTARYLEQATRR